MGESGEACPSLGNGGHCALAHVRTAALRYLHPTADLPNTTVLSTLYPLGHAALPCVTLPCPQLQRHHAAHLSPFLSPCACVQ
jgi:hypothetical protein